jgi:UDP-N-acetylglucosamine--N-acetylmuramyl-(pentapeptide) pyrophosphoryl-undecaprenol N-acetylglucosamine transferase
VLTGGGTGGHVYPALSVAEKLLQDETVEALLYVGASGHVEERLTKEHHIDFIGLDVSGLPRRPSLKLFTWPFEFARAVKVASNNLQKFRATAVLGTGGYASAPALMAAQRLKIPIAIHEPDAHPGLVNRIFGRYAQLISLGMEGAQGSFQEAKSCPKFLGFSDNLSRRIVVNGNPVSERFFTHISRQEASRIIGLAPDLKTVLVTGGSQGARALNEALEEALFNLFQGSDEIQVLHQVGEKNWHEMEAPLKAAQEQYPHYKPLPYVDNMALAYAASDLTVCRAGAMTIAELFITGMPAIFVPLPSAAQDHQTFNACFVAQKGAAKVLKQEKLTGETLAETILSTISDGEALKEMSVSMKSMARPEAASRLAEQLTQLSAGRPVT